MLIVVVAHRVRQLKVLVKVGERSEHKQLRSVRELYIYTVHKSDGLHTHPPPQPSHSSSPHPYIQGILVPGWALDRNCRIAQYEHSS